MPLASYRRAPEQPAQARRRGAAFALAIIAHLLVLWLLLRLPQTIFAPVAQRALPATFEMLPGAQEAAPPAPKPRRVAKTAASSAASHHAPTPTPVPNPPPPPPAPISSPAPMLLGGDLFDTGDISKLGRHADDEDDGASGAGAGKDSVAVYGPGEGPGGQRLFNAEWVREPSHAELAGYLPNGAPAGSWAMVACQTVERFRVDNCRTLDESPPGLGLARSLRLAAWQFLIRPPRIGGKSLIGAWVRIRVDFTASGDIRAR